MKNLLIKTSGNQKLLIIVIALYIGFFFTNPKLVSDSFNTFFNLLKSVLPVFVLVFVLIFIFNLILSSKIIIKILGEESGVKGYIFSILFGILSSGPIYMWYPLLSDLKEKGVNNSLITVFLYNRAIKIPLLPMMIFYFGYLFVIILTFFMIVFSVLNGLLVNKLLLTQKK
jgi:uncharacterized membrane protein YraQ (UPF0718 family)